MLGIGVYNLASIADKVFKNAITNSTEQSEKELLAKEKWTQPPELKSKKITVRAWSSQHGTPHVVGKKTIKYGQPLTVIKIGGKERVYRINYREHGMIKQEGKFLYYDTSFLNTVGGLSFHEYPEDMESSETYEAFLHNGVDMYVKKGGISLKVLIIVAIIGAIGVMGLAIESIYTSSTMQQNDANSKNLIKLSGMIDQLRAQIQNLGAKPIV